MASDAAGRNCARDGHCFHTEGGALFQRHSGRPKGKVTVHCCWCPVTAATEGYSRQTRPAQPPPFHVENHGEYLGELGPVT